MLLRKKPMNNLLYNYTFDLLTQEFLGCVIGLCLWVFVLAVILYNNREDKTQQMYRAT